MEKVFLIRLPLQSHFITQMRKVVQKRKPGSLPACLIGALAEKVREGKSLCFNAGSNRLFWRETILGFVEKNVQL